MKAQARRALWGTPFFRNRFFWRVTMTRERLVNGKTVRGLARIGGRAAYIRLIWGFEQAPDDGDSNLERS